MKFGRWQFTPHWVATLVYLPLCALLISLGVWQWNRGAEKDVIESDADRLDTSMEIRIDGAIQTLPRRHQKLVASGAYLDAKQFLVDNRTYKGRAGYHIITPLKLTSGQYLLVNRGWLPVGLARETLPDVTVQTQSRTVRGKAHLPAQDQMLLGASGFEQKGWPRLVQRLEIPTVESILGDNVLPFTLRLAPSDSDGYLREWPLYYGISADRHRGYAFQWFSLATALTVIYIVVNAKRRSDQSTSTDL